MGGKGAAERSADAALFPRIGLSALTSWTLVADPAMSSLNLRTTRRFGGVSGGSTQREMTR
jgi:hypothetical protein